MKRIISGWRIPLISILFTLTISSLLSQHYETLEKPTFNQSYRVMMRFNMYISALLFIFYFASIPLYRTWGNDFSQWMMINRHHFNLASSFIILSTYLYSLYFSVQSFNDLKYILNESRPILYFVGPYFVVGIGIFGLILFFLNVLRFFVNIRKFRFQPYVTLLILVLFYFDSTVNHLHHMHELTNDENREEHIFYIVSYLFITASLIFTFYLKIWDLGNKTTKRVLNKYKVE